MNTPAHGLWDAMQAAAFLSVTKQTLAKWRCLHKGPAFVKIGHTVWYRPQDVRDWVDQSVITPPRHARTSP